MGSEEGGMSNARLSCLLVRLTLINGTPDWARSSVRPVGRRLARSRRPSARQTARITGTSIAGSTLDGERDGGHCCRVVWNGDESAAGRAQACRAGPVFYCWRCCVVVVVIVVVSGVMYRWTSTAAPIYRRRRRRRCFGVISSPYSRHASM